MSLWPLFYFTYMGDAFQSGEICQIFVIGTEKLERTLTYQILKAV